MIFFHVREKNVLVTLFRISAVNMNLQLNNEMNRLKVRISYNTAEIKDHIGGDLLFRQWVKEVRHLKM